MPIRDNGYYNDPNIGQGFSNLAALFAPPSGTDIAHGAVARATMEKAARLSDLYRQAGSPNFDQTQFDRKNVAVGNYSPNAGYYAVDQNNFTSRANNRADNARALDQTVLQQGGETTRKLLDPVSAGATRFVPPSVASMYAVDPIQFGQVTLNQGQTATLPDGRTIAGAPKPPSMDEVQAAAFGTLPASEQRAVVTKDIKPLAIEGKGGARYAAPMDAIGQEPHYEDKSKPELRNFKAPDGRSGSAYYDADTNNWLEAGTGAKLPSGTVTYGATLQGDQAGTGLGQAGENRAAAQIMDIDAAKQTALRYRDLIAAHPGSQGLVGAIRGTVQDVVAAGGEVGALLGKERQARLKDLQTGYIPPELAGKFDPNIPAAEFLRHSLIAQHAKAMSTDGRISVDMFNKTERALGGGGLTANQPKTLASLDELIKQLDSQRTLASTYNPKAGAIVGGAAPPNTKNVVPPPTDTSAAPSSVGQTPRLRFNPASGAIE